jgi:glycosyltransferase involved in cell wall biosynthesis
MTGRSVIWATLATAVRMGQQHTEDQLQAALDGIASGWEFSTVTVRSMRSPHPGGARLPFRALSQAPLEVAALAARFVYPRARLVHRFDLRLPPAPGAEVITVHDLAPLRFGDEGSLPRWALAAARRGSVIACPSSFAADEVRSLTGASDVRVIPNGVHERFGREPPMTQAELDRRGLRGPYVLHAGGCTTRKNLVALANAWSRVRDARPDAMLALCGPPDSRRDALFGKLPGARILGRVPICELARMMAAASVVVVPSVYEGFGLPALEAMACGAPVVAAGCSSLPELCGGAALIVPPTPAGLAQGLVQALAGGTRVSELAREGRDRARSFTWRRAAERYLTLYNEVITAAA